MPADSATGIPAPKDWSGEGGDDGRARYEGKCDEIAQGDTTTCGAVVAVSARKVPEYDLRWVSARMLFAFSVVFLTFNPTGYSYLHWLFQADDSYLSAKVLIGVLLFILFQILFQITFSTFRLSGLIAGLFGAVLLSYCALDVVLSSERFETFDGYLLWFGYLMSMSLAIVIGAGTGWSQLMTRLSGQEYKRFLARR